MTDLTTCLGRTVVSFKLWVGKAIRSIELSGQFCGSLKGKHSERHADDGTWLSVGSLGIP